MCVYSLLSYSIVQSPSWEANRFSASQEIPRILRNSKVHYRIHKRPSPFPILRQLDPVHNTTSHFLKIHLNIIFPFTSGFPKWSLSFRFPHPNPVHTSPLPHTRYMPVHLILLDFITLKILGAQYRSLSSSLYSPRHSPVTSSLLGPNILLNTIFSNTLGLRYSLNVSDQVSYPHKKRHVLYRCLRYICLRKRSRYSEIRKKKPINKR